LNKKKIFNDPLYGLIMFQHEILYEIIDHPYFQRLRRISQQALSHYVYPGAMHTRFQHALGSLHLMTKALEVIRSKGHSITDEESEATCIAILLHDLGHGPFSHALEHMIVDCHHEDISLAMMREIGQQLGRDFSLAVKIFSGSYHRPFLHELVSGQIDIDRMDYLMRDSYFSGVAEGIIGYDRIIMMMNVVDDRLVIEEKGIYSIEKFLMARRLMYWQVYLHKTVVAAEVMLISIVKRVKNLMSQGAKIVMSPSLEAILTMKDKKSPVDLDDEFLHNFAKIDDTDVMSLIKGAVEHEDFILRYLCNNLLERKLFKLSLPREDYTESDRMKLRHQIMNKNQLLEVDLDYIFIEKLEKFSYYETGGQRINVLKKNGTVVPYEDCVNVDTVNCSEEVLFSFVPF
jgi:uncharacterized protein